MGTEFTTMPRLTFQITPDTIDMFTSLLQAGILVPTAQGNSIGAFLESLPGFTADYITDQVQTIFLNGIATDDMTTVLTGENPVLAISAAMPGLAGAIFRKNSLHAALRTTQSKQEHASSGSKVTVTLKLFNSIARDRGAKLLRQGVTLGAAGIVKFLNSRSTASALILTVKIEGKDIPKDDMMTSLSALDTVHLTLVD